MCSKEPYIPIYAQNFENPTYLLWFFDTNKNKKDWEHYVQIRAQKEHYVHIHAQNLESPMWGGVATISRLLKIIGLFWKRALLKKRYSQQETWNFKEPTNCSHPMPLVTLLCIHTHIYIYVRILDVLNIYTHLINICTHLINIYTHLLGCPQKSIICRYTLERAGYRCREET